MLLMMSGAESTEERHFYMPLCAKENYSKRELADFAMAGSDER